LLKEMFNNTKTTAGRLHVAKQLLTLPVGNLKSFAGSKEGLAILNSWILVLFYHLMNYFQTIV